MEGTQTLNNIKVNGCKIRSITVRYRLGTLVGQATVYTTVRWTGENSESDCLSDQRFIIFLNISAGGMRRYVRSGGSADMIVAKGNNQWANNPLAGSPNWNKIITETPGLDEEVEYFSEEKAKNIWKNGFSVVGVEIIPYKSNKSTSNTEKQEKLDGYRAKIQELNEMYFSVLKKSYDITEVDKSSIENSKTEFNNVKSETLKMLSNLSKEGDLSEVEITNIEDNLSRMELINTDIGETTDVLRIHNQQRIKDKADSIKNSDQIANSTSTYVESTQDREARLRRKRIDEVRKKDRQEELVGTAITAGVVGTALNENLNNDKITGKTTYFKAGVFGAMYGIPAIENASDDGQISYSSLDNHFNYGGQVQLDAWLYNDNKFGFLLQPLLYYGVNIGAGINGTQSIYGANGRVQYGKTVKLFAEVGYFQRTGDEKRDFGAMNETYTSVASSDVIGSLNYSYVTYRYGGGLIIGPINNNLKGREIGLKLGMYVENPNYTNYDQTKITPMVFQLQWTFEGGFYIGGEYSTGYPYANEAKYAIDEIKKGIYYSIQFGKTFNLTLSK